MKIYYYEHDCRSFSYSVHTTEADIVEWDAYKFAKPLYEWIGSIPEKRFALTEKEIIEKVNASIKEDLKYIEAEYINNKNRLNDLLVNGFKITNI